MIERKSFVNVIEVVPPAGPDAETVLSGLETLKKLPVHAFSVATNPVARPRMSALAMCNMIQSHLSFPAILHCTTRDHNRLSLQSLLWGAKALGIETIMATTGDFIALKDLTAVSSVRDIDVYDLIGMAKKAGLSVGVVFDPFSGNDGGKGAVKKLVGKVKAGAAYAVTQPVYDDIAADDIHRMTESIDIPVLIGVLPLRSYAHAQFLHDKVSGISVPDMVMERMKESKSPVAEGAANAREMVALAKSRFKGVCIMPPFDHYEILFDIL